jgi:hypothetical protein
MTAPAAPIIVDLPSHRCGYDLRAQPQHGECPECGGSVEEARRAAAIPLRPAWRDSDPRWRRRVLAGAWLLVLLPLVDILQASGWASSVPVPTLFDSKGVVRTLDETLLTQAGIYPPVVFCTGVVLLFAKERGRRRGPWDWTRRWGVLCSYVAFLLSATQVLHFCALVLTGIATNLQSISLRYQPRATQWFIDVSTNYMWYGPQPGVAAGVVLVVSSSIAVLLACVPLYDALRSSGPKRFAAILLAPLALFALMHLLQAGRYWVATRFWIGMQGLTPADLYLYSVYFSPAMLVSPIAGLPPGVGVPGSLVAVCVEVVKWCTVLAIAVWLSIAQRAVRRERKKTTTAQCADSSSGADPLAALRSQAPGPMPRRSAAQPTDLSSAGHRA